MEKVSHFRARALIALVALVLGFFGYRLYDLQIFETGGSKDNTTAYTTQTRVKAARGDILDRNGNVLVGNRASYDLVINHFVLRSSGSTNQSIYNLVTLCKEKDIAYTDRFPVTQERPFTYTLETYNSAWQGYFQKFLQQGFGFVFPAGNFRAGVQSTAQVIDDFRQHMCLLGNVLKCFIAFPQGRILL